MTMKLSMFLFKLNKMDMLLKNIFEPDMVMFKIPWYFIF